MGGKDQYTASRLKNVYIDKYRKDFIHTFFLSSHLYEFSSGSCGYIAYYS